MKSTNRFQPLSALGGIALAACIGLGLASTASAALLVHYTFDGDTGNTAVNQGTAGASANATITGGAFVTDSERGQVLSMTGTGSNGAFASLSVSSTTQSYTFMFWYKGGDTQGYLYDQGGTVARLIPSLGSSTQQDPADNAQPAGLGAFTSGTSNQWRNSMADNTTWTTGEWTHVAWVFEKDGLGVGVDSYSIYLDGVAQNVFGPTGFPGEETKRALGNSIPNLGGTQRLFARFTASGDADQLVGLMDDVRIYDTVLSEAEIVSIIPEPTSAILLGLGGLALLGRRRRN